MLEILNQRKAYQSTRSRDSLEVKRPGQAFFGPMVVLQNERSASDAEMFPDGFRASGAGQDRGRADHGRGDRNRLVHSAGRLRPAHARLGRLQRATGENLENFGVPPDVYEDNGPADFLAHHDRQVEKAIEVLRGELR